MARATDLSIVTICFENPEDLEATLASCAGLDAARTEIIVQDGSRDSRCEDVAGRSPLAIRYRRERDSGKYDAMNRATARAEGRTILYLNSGDRLVDAAALSTLIAENHADLESTILYGDVIDLFGDTAVPRAPMLAVGPEQIRTGTFPSHQAILLPAAYAQAHPYDVALDISADTLFLRGAFTALPSRRIATPIAYFSYGGISNSTGTFAQLVRAYRETVRVRDYRPAERMRLMAQLLARKLGISILGRDRYLGVQARRARARAEERLRQA